MFPATLASVTIQIKNLAGEAVSVVVAFPPAERVRQEIPAPALAFAQLVPPTTEVNAFATIPIRISTEVPASVAAASRRVAVARVEIQFPAPVFVPAVLTTMERSAYVTIRVWTLMVRVVHAVAHFPLAELVPPET